MYKRLSLSYRRKTTHSLFLHFTFFPLNAWRLVGDDEGGGLVLSLAHVGAVLRLPLAVAGRSVQCVLRGTTVAAGAARTSSCPSPPPTSISPVGISHVLQIFRTAAPTPLNTEYVVGAGER